jgi:Flp pilus assembly protein TadG
MVTLRPPSRLGRRLCSAQGAELIEFSLVLPVLLVVLGGILDMGFLFNNYAVVTNAAREGARIAAIPGWVEDDVKARVAEYIEGAGLTLSRVTTTVQPVAVVVGGGTINAVKVQVSYPYDYMILGPLVQMIQGGSLAGITLKAAATMRTEVAAGL